MAPYGNKLDAFVRCESRLTEVGKEGDGIKE